MSRKRVQKEAVTELAVSESEPVIENGLDTQPFTLDMEDNTLYLDFRSLGSSGLNRYGGFINEEYLPQLAGQRAAKVYKEMLDNDPSIFAMDLLLDFIVRSVDWYAKPANMSWVEQEKAEFLEQCMFDMESPWTDFISTAATCHWYGFSLAEKVYKRRCGNDPDPSRYSKFADGRVGWRDLADRSQDSIFRWHFDRAGYWRGCQQIAPPDNEPVDLWRPKLLLFRARVRKQNPEGRATLRGAYRPWYIKQKLENFQLIGAERDLVGVPKMTAPIQFMQKGATTAQKAVWEDIKNMGQRLRINQQSCIALPSTRDKNGNELFGFELIRGAGPKQYDTKGMIDACKVDIFRVAMMDFLALGTGGDSSTGSWAMHSDKTRLFTMAIETLLDSIAQVLNKDAVPSLFRYNQFGGDPTVFPTICHAKVSKTDLKELGGFLESLTKSGMQIFPNPDVEKYVSNVCGIPAPTEGDAFAPAQPAPPQQSPTGIREIHDTQDDKQVGQGNEGIEGTDVGTDVKPQDDEARAVTNRPIKIY